jgi:probable F420-dependent oxidoreductase
MKLDWNFPVSVADAPATAARAEALGYAGLWANETPHDPFLPLAAAAPATTRLELGTGVATAFTRSPMVTALTAWDLQRAANGRFVLGLGSQVPAHNKRRYGVPSDSPGPRLRETVEALRHIWGAFQGEHRLEFRGRFVELDLMTPMHSPGPIDDPHIPIYLAAVRPYGYRLAGEVADGVHVHSFATLPYLTEVALPALEEGLARAGRERQDVQLAAALFVCVGDDQAVTDAVRTQIAFYGSTSAYRGVLDVHGWGDLQGTLRDAVTAGDSAALAAAVDDDVLAEFAIVAPTWEQAMDAVRARYEGVLDRIAVYALGGIATEADAEAIASAFAAAGDRA